MKKFIVFASAIAALFASTGCQQNAAQPAACASDSTLSIAYINTDSLLVNYEYAQTLNDQLMSKGEASRADFNQKYRVFQQDAIDFQRKVQNNAFLSMDRAQKEQQRLQKVEQDLAELENKLTNEIAQEQARMSKELQDTLNAFLADYATGRYSLVLNTSMMNNTVLFAAPGIDITGEVIEKLNGRYKASKK